MDEDKDFEDSSILFTSRHATTTFVYFLSTARASGLWTTKNSNREWVVDLETQVKEEFVGAKGV